MDIEQTKEEILEELETIEYLEKGKLIRAFGGFMDAQLKVLRDQIWDNPEWEKAIMERRYEDLPKLALAVDTGGAQHSTITVVDTAALLKESA
jgi:hypothetical protein